MSTDGTDRIISDMYGHFMPILKAYKNMVSGYTHDKRSVSIQSIQYCSRAK